MNTLLGWLLGTAPPPWLIETLSAAAFVATVGCVWWVVRATWRRDPDGNPSPLTWGSWGLVSMIATVAMIRGGADWTAWLQKGALGVGPVLVWAVARHRRIPYVVDRHDRAALILAAIGTGAYIATGARESAIAITTAIIVDLIGGWPTLRRGWRAPFGEPIRTYAIAFTALTTTFLIIPAPWTFTSVAALAFVWAQMLAIIVTFTVGRRRARRRALRDPGPDAHPGAHPAAA